MLTLTEGCKVQSTEIRQRTEINNDLTLLRSLSFYSVEPLLESQKCLSKAECACDLMSYSEGMNTFFPLWLFF